MERGSLLRWILIGAAIFLFFQFGYPLIFGSGGGSQQPFGDIVDDTAPEGERPEAKTCRLAGPRFSAEMSSRGAVLTHVWMGDPKYTVEPGNSDAAPIDLVSTTLDGVMPLRTDLRSPFGDTEQVPYNDLDWTLVEGDGTRCVFRYEDERVRIDKTIATTERAFELTLDLAVTNKAEEPQKHRLAVQQTDWRTDEETSGSLGREGEFMTRTELYSGDEADRKSVV